MLVPPPRVVPSSGLQPLELLPQPEVREDERKTAASLAKELAFFEKVKLIVKPFILRRYQCFLPKRDPIPLKET